MEERRVVPWAVPRTWLKGLLPDLVHVLKTKLWFSCKYRYTKVPNIGIVANSYQRRVGLRENHSPVTRSISPAQQVIDSSLYEAISRCLCF
jgi:hypothetical protein